MIPLITLTLTSSYTTYIGLSNLMLILNPVGVGVEKGWHSPLA